MKRERKRMLRMYDLTRAVPFPQDGSTGKTAALIGMVSYQADMREFMQAMGDFYLGVLAETRPGLSENEDYYNPDLVLDAIEQWIKIRIAAAWDINQMPKYSTIRNGLIELRIKVNDDEA